MGSRIRLSCKMEKTVQQRAQNIELLLEVSIVFWEPGSGWIVLPGATQGVSGDLQSSFPYIESLEEFISLVNRW